MGEAGGKYLHLNIQYTYPFLFRNILHGLDACAVVIASELRVLDEAIGVDEGFEKVFCCEIVVDTVFLARSWRARCVCEFVIDSSVAFAGVLRFTGMGWTERGRTWEKDLEGRGYSRETEKPNVLGCSAKRRLRRVDFPAPEGPDMTIGRYFWLAVVVSAGGCSSLV